ALINNFELKKLVKEISKVNKIKIIKTKVFRKKYGSEKGFFFLKITIINDKVYFIKDSFL
ncbi:hypothetical protein B0H65DRAFT_436279, partial [Neurospora tetraspora]